MVDFGAKSRVSSIGCHSISRERLAGVENDRRVVELPVLVALVESLGPMDLSGGRIPLDRVKRARRVEIFEQLDFETGLLEQAAKGLAGVEHFVIVGPCTASADADPFDVSGIGMKAVRNGDPQIAAGLQEPQTIAGGDADPARE